MRLKLIKLWRFRPRLLTLALLAIIAAMIVLANLTDEISRRGADAVGKPVHFSLLEAGPIDSNRGFYGMWNVSYGWPLRWRQYILGLSPGPSGLLGEFYSAGRLAWNFAIWFVLLAAPGAGCEWLLRRYRPRFRWSLRTMLAGVCLSAALCGWFAAARNRANLQDAVIENKNHVWVERWGPKWLELVGADRYRRKLFGAKLDLTLGLTDELKVDEEDFQRKEELLKLLARLRDLQYLFIEVDDHSPGLVDALSSLRQLRVLSIHRDDGLCYYYGQRFSQEDKRMSHECLAAIGAMHELEYLSLRGMPTASESLACLAGLTNLKSLDLQVNHDADGEASDAPLLSRLPALPCLEAVDLESSYVGDRGLRYLSVLPRLKTLNLNWTSVIEYDLADLPRLKFDAGLADLARLELLEEAAVMGDMSSATGLESLLILKHLKKLHVGGPYIARHPTAELTLDDGEKEYVLQVEADRCRRALDALRQANPGIVIDGNVDALEWPGELLVPAEYETLPEGGLRAAALSFVRESKQRSAPAE